MHYEWRGEFTSSELNRLHADAFGHRVFSDDEWDWRRLVDRHSLGWVTARSDGRLVGFVNLPWDGFVHAWVQDVAVASDARREGVGSGLVEVARTEAAGAGCEWLHVDFDEELRPFYESCGFTRTEAGLIELT